MVIKLKVGISTDKLSRWHFSFVHFESFKLLDTQKSTNILQLLRRSFTLHGHELQGNVNIMEIRFHCQCSHKLFDVQVFQYYINSQREEAASELEKASRMIPFRSAKMLLNILVDYILLLCCPESIRPNKRQITNISRKEFNF